MIIHPEVLVTPDLPTIRFREPKDQIDLDIELPKILHAQGWGCGTYFNIQFMNHEKTQLLSSAKYVVTEEDESVGVNEANPYQPVTKTIYARKAERIGDWWNSSFYSEKASEVVWNPGKKVHQLKVDGKVIFENKDKDLVMAAQV